MEIPALWTDLTADQKDEGRAYVHAVFFTTMRSRGDGLYRVTYAKDSRACCGECGCPIGRNHNYLRSDFSGRLYPPLCFACAEQIYHEEFLREEDYDEADDFSLEERHLIAPSFLRLRRIPKEVLNP